MFATLFEEQSVLLDDVQGLSAAIMSIFYFFLSIATVATHITIPVSGLQTLSL